MRARDPSPQAISFFAALLAGCANACDGVALLPSGTDTLATSTVPDTSTQTQILPCDTEWEKWTPQTPDAAACWQPADWADWDSTSKCSLFVAQRPAAAAPWLEWETCPGANKGERAPGCMATRIDWPTEGLPIQASVTRFGAGFRVGARLRMKYEARVPRGYMAAIWDEAGVPLAVWKADRPGCITEIPQVTESGVWMGASSLDVGEARFIWADWDELPGGTRLPDFPVPLNLVGHDEVLVLAAFSHEHLDLYDRATGTSHTFWSPDFAPFLPMGDHAIGGLLGPNGLGVWSRVQGLQRVRDVSAGRWISNAASDGQTMVWVESDELYFHNAVLWKSTLAKTEADTAAVLLRGDLGTIPLQETRTGEGHYALYSSPWVTLDKPGDGRIHVYRLSDGHHWSLGVRTEWLDVRQICHVDAEEVWYVADEGPLVRQRIDVFDPGDPAP